MSRLLAAAALALAFSAPAYANELDDQIERVAFYGFSAFSGG
jgi:hypothetical protein